MADTAVVGSGLIAGRLRTAGPWDAVITASDDGEIPPRPSGFRDTPWLPVWVDGDVVVIGPLTMPAERGCAHCFVLRRGTAVERPHATVTPLAASLVSTMVAAELSRTRRRPSVLLLSLDDLSLLRQAFLPEPLCPRCGGLPDDTRADAVVTLESRPKPGPTQYRRQPLVDRHADLMSTYATGVAGLLHHVRHDDRGGLAVAQAPTTLRGPGVTAYGGGQSWDYRTSEAAAILEALERYGGANPAGKRTVVRGALAELDEPALDPRALGLHEDEFYDDPDAGYRRFTENAACNWVWGYSFAQSQPILVPECAAYFWTHRRPDPSFLYDTTNACAVGSCREEAILYAILENAERDAFLLTWHARIPAPAIDLTATEDRTLAITATAITHATGYDVAVFDTTTETGIPCVWAMATRPRPKPGELARFCAAGAHLVPERAVFSALAELGSQLPNAVERYQTVPALTNPDEVRTIFDHAALYGDPQAAARFDFLGRGAQRALADIGRAPIANLDLRDDLIEVIGRYLAQGLDVIVVDQTSPEHRAAGLVAVKAIIPGSVPLTYGHRRRRLRGLPRLLSVAQRLGHTTRTWADLNVLPHPFAA
jgi:ribosomal protein S12 methylthiotransferase accessory factor